MSKILIVGIVFIGAAVVTKQSLELPVARLTLRAIDEQGAPVAKASVRMGFDEAFPSWGGGAVVSVTGVTDSNGKFAGQGHSFDTKGGEIQKSGFYPSSPESYKFEKPVAGRWQPWNPTLDVVLKRILNPIPMFARKVMLEIPELDKPIGFDLEISDWVAPYGRGVNNDLIFKLTKSGESFENFSAELSLSFGKEADGIQKMQADMSGSELESPHLALEKNYESSISFWRGNSSKSGEYGMEVPNTNYFFRIRSIINKDGTIKVGNFGKIYKGIEFFPVSSKTAKIRFTYYLNPTPGDRNIEFDPSKNLLTELKPDEQVTAP